MMKMTTILAFILVLALLAFAACSSESSVLQEATGATSEQINTIEEWLDEANIICQSVSTSSHPLTKDMDDGWKAYDVIGEDGNSYLLILSKENNDFTAVLDSEGNLLAGMIDNAVFPNFDFKTSEWPPLIDPQEGVYPMPDDANIKTPEYQVS